MRVVVAEIRDARPRAKAVAWWAVLASCMLHAGLAGLWWRERIEPIGRSAAHPPDLSFFVDLLPEKVPQRSSSSQQMAAGAFAGNPGPATPARIDTPSIPSAPPRQRSGAYKTPAPPSPQRAPAQASGTQDSHRDFGWRAEDAASAGMPRSRGEPVVRLGPKAPVEQSELARGIAKSARPPCKNAHADMGLLALPFLLADTVTDRGCKW